MARVQGTYIMVIKKLKAQQPAEGVLKMNCWSDTQTYKVMCSCGDDEHNHNVWIEQDNMGVVVNVYTQVCSPWWKTNRFKTIWTLLTQGYVEYETSLIMTEQQALNYAETLKTAIQDIKDKNGII